MVAASGYLGAMGVKGAVACMVLVAMAMALAATAASAGERVQSGRLSARVAADPWHLSFADAGLGEILSEDPGLGSGGAGRLGFRTASGYFHATRVLTDQRSGGAYVASLATNDPLGRRIALRIEPARRGAIALRAGVVGLPGAEAVGVAFRTPPDESFFGFGERSNFVDQRGHEVENYVSDGPFPEEDRNFVRPTTPPWGIRDRDDATYFPIPWLLSSHGYGVLIDRDETSSFDLAHDDPGRWSLEVEASTLALRVFAGPEPAGALRRFSAAVGRQPPAAAPWSFGPWFQTGQPNTIPLDEEAEIIRTLRSADAPVSAAETQLHFLPCGAQVGKGDYIAARTRQFHAAGLAHLGYFNPHLCRDYSPVYERAAAAGVLQRDPSGQPFTYPAFVGGDGPAGFTEKPLALFDFTAPRTSGFYEGLLREAYDAGYDGWMEDFGEYSPPVAVSADGTPPERMHNRYPTTYHCAVAKIAKRLGERPLSRHQRSGWTGSAACADIVWGGDPTTRWGFDGLSSTIKQGMGIGMSGVSRWGSDIGGYFSFGGNNPRPDGAEREELTPELLKRWIEVGAVSPVMRTKRSGIAVPSYERPQVFDPGILATWRRYTKLHTQLYPYLRAADATYRRTGMPIMRHGILTNPEDPRAVAADGQFMFGPDLLTAPVVAPGQRRQRVYAPEGRWLDFWKSVRYRRGSGAFVPRRPRLRRGGREVALDAGLNRLPLLIRAGALLPLLPADVDTLARYGKGAGLVHLSERRRRLVLLAFPRGRSEAGFYDRGRLISREGRGVWRLRVEGGDAARRWQVRATLGTLEHPFVPRAVKVDGRVLDPRRWSYDPGRTVLSVRAKLRGSTLTVRGR